MPDSKNNARQLEIAAREVLARFEVEHDPANVQALGNCGGFSGAQLWRIETKRGPLCLRAWPEGQTVERLAGIHRHMHLARSAGLAYVPAVYPAGDGATILSHGGRFWELVAWMPGTADFHARPSNARLESACAALAQLHLVWSHEGPGPGICPAIVRRLQHVAAWRERAAAGWQVPPANEWDRLTPLAERAWKLVRPQLESLEQALRPWLHRPVPLQPCLCDIWHDHVLFEDARVSGLIDFGTVKIDNVAADLARMLGSLVEDNAAWREAGLAAYRRLRPLALEEEALVPVLDRATTILGAANWLRWLYLERKHFEDLAAVEKRLARLVRRMENGTLLAEADHVGGCQRERQHFHLTGSETNSGDASRATT